MPIEHAREVRHCQSDSFWNQAENPARGGGEPPGMQDGLHAGAPEDRLTALRRATMVIFYLREYP